MSAGGNILLVEDEENLGSTLSDVLKDEGFNVSWCKTISDAQIAISAHPSEMIFELALLDIGLPDGSGLDLAPIIREKDSAIAIVFLTAHGSPDDRLKGLEAGAEDYIVKPFHLKELLLRVQNVLTRREKLASKTDKINLGKAIIDFPGFRLESGGRTHALSHKECAILKLLVENKNRAVSRDEILESIWSKEEYPTNRTIDNFIVKLRRLVEHDSENPKIITSIRGVGYQIVSEDN